MPALGLNTAAGLNDATLERVDRFLDVLERFAVVLEKLEVLADAAEA